MTGTILMRLRTGVSLFGRAWLPRAVSPRKD
jgi:hypothetical protein